MGILGLSKLIADVAPSAIKENEFKNYFGRKIAVDASMSLYQFLIAVRQQPGEGGAGGAAAGMLTSADGETTSHLMGFFYRTIRMVENGIKPVYVFDGKPPTMKSGELEKRTNKRAVAEKALEVAVESGDVAEVDKQQRRLVKVGKQHVDEAQKLLSLMGVPFINAPCEAEAQCAWFARSNAVYGVATEDMDALTFGTKVLLRHLTFSEARKMSIKEFHLQRVLQEAKLNMEQFVDLCILLGCDYCDSIRGVGPKRAFEMITKFKNIEGVLEHIDKGKYGVPENWPYQEARRLFNDPEVDKDVVINWGMQGDEEGLVQYLHGEKGFAEDRVRNGWRKLASARGKATQVRLDNFFTVTSSAAAKRPAAAAANSSAADKKKKTAAAAAGKKGGSRRGGK